ncbi:MAG: HAD family hydrolase [Candidatus Pacebacteria bacterium]|nr:HAD family hydrolase [Candidatus Paceibacterota bacterium]
MLLKKIKNIIKRKLVRVIVWDFDDTLYINSQVGEALKKGYYNYLNKNLNKKISTKEFDQLIKQHGRWSKAVAKKLNKKELDVINYVEEKVDKSKLLKPNKKLVKQLEKLNSYQHLILSNTPKAELEKCLKKIGFKKNKKLVFSPFTKIIDCNETKSLKPNLAPFKKVLTETKLFPKMILMVGDSYKNDIEPAKKLGFQAILVDELKDFLGIKLENKCK